MEHHQPIEMTNVNCIVLCSCVKLLFRSIHSAFSFTLKPALPTQHLFLSLLQTMSDNIKITTAFMLRWVLGKMKLKQKNKTRNEEVQQKKEKKDFLN